MANDVISRRGLLGAAVGVAGGVAGLVALPARA